MRDNYVDMQHICLNMQENYLITRFEVKCMSTFFCCMFNMNKSQGNRIMLQDNKISCRQGQICTTVLFLQPLIIGIIQGQ